MDSQNFGDELAQLLILLSAHEPHRIGKQNFASECVMCYFVAMFLCGLIILGPRTVKLIAHTRMSWLGATELRTVASVLRNMFAIGARQRIVMKISMLQPLMPNTYRSNLWTADRTVSFTRHWLLDQLAG